MTKPELPRSKLSYALDAIHTLLEEPWLSADGVMNEGELASRLGLPGIPKAAETIMLERDGNYPPALELLDELDAIAAAVSGTPGAHLLDRTSDTDHNRSVLTFAGEEAAVDYLARAQRAFYAEAQDVTSGEVLADAGGEKAGFVIANLALALGRDDVGPKVRQFIEEL